MLPFRCHFLITILPTLSNGQHKDNRHFYHPKSYSEVKRKSQRKVDNNNNSYFLWLNTWRCHYTNLVWYKALRTYRLESKMIEKSVTNNKLKSHSCRFDYVRKGLWVEIHLAGALSELISQQWQVRSTSTVSSEQFHIGSGQRVISNTEWNINRKNIYGTN